MNNKFTSFLQRLKNLLWLGFCAGILLIISHSASAVLITFDELDLNSYRDENGDVIYVANEYESQGVVFKGSIYLMGGHEGPSEIHPSNFITGLGIGFEFVGEDLPTQVSFTLGSGMRAAVFIDVLGPYYKKSVTSAGEIHDINGNEGTEYIPNQYFSFSARTGISSVHLSTQADVYIDNLNYVYASPTQVPEPSSFILLGVGLLGLMGSRLNTRK